MKIIGWIWLMVGLQVVVYGQDEVADCFPDKGIKTQKIIEPGHVTLIECDTLGRQIHVTRPRSEARYIYEGKMIKYVIIKMPAIDDSGESLEGSSDLSLDTTVYTRHDAYGRGLEGIAPDGMVIRSRYQGCEEVTHTFYLYGEEMSHEMQYIFKEGLQVQYAVRSYHPASYERSMTFYDYTFNERGDWITRTAKDQNGNVSIQKRELTYYGE